MESRIKIAARRRRCAMLFGALTCGFVWLGWATAGPGEEPSRASGEQLLDEVGITPPLGDRVPLELEFVDADGRPVRLEALFAERPVLLHLVYYECPMLCKLSSDGLLRALETVSLDPGADFTVVTISFDPREGPELSARARLVASERFGAAVVDHGWRFLTGDEPAIRALCDAVGFRYRWDESTGQYAHASGVFVLTSDGTISRYLSGVEYSPRDLRLALVEASQGKIGTAADQVLLLCYMYDPSTGKYGLAIMTGLRAAGAATVGGLALAIGWMLHRERVAASTPSDSSRFRESFT